MKLIQIVLFSVLNLCFAPLSNCFFLRNPLNWFGFGNSNVAQNQIESSTENVGPVEPTVPIAISPPTPTPQQLPFLPIQPIQTLQVQPLPVPQSMQPLTLSGLGVPIKMNRFGLEPLPYPLKRIQSRFPAHNSPHLNLNPNLNFNRRYGDLTPDSTVSSSFEPTLSSAYQEVNPTEEYFSTFGSIKESKANTIMKQKVTNQNKYELSEENIENSSPMPVYISSSTASSTEGHDGHDVIITSEPSESTTTQYKPSYLHKADFASQLNNMYYNRPDVFDRMMNQFPAKKI